MNRKEEISKLLRLTEEQVMEKAGKHLKVFDDCDGIHRYIADEMLDFIKMRNKENKTSSFILPVGPTGQYPLLLEMIHLQKVSLKNCWFFFMDENADNSGYDLSPEHPLSFQGEMRRLLLNHIDDELAVPEDQLIFPGRENISRLAEKIDSVGGIDICFGGVGIHGHLAFNEPEPDVVDSDPRLVYLNDFTTTINAIRAKVGGNLEGFPRKAYTLGLRQILGAKKLVLISRNGISVDWANTVLRLTLFGESGEDYPCTFANKHKNYEIITDCDTLRQPQILL